MNKMRVQKYLSLSLALCALMVIVGIVLVHRLRPINMPLSIDPYTFMGRVVSSDTVHHVTNGNTLLTTPFIDHYPPLFTLAAWGAYRLGIPLLDLFTYGGLVLFLVGIPIFFAIAYELTRRTTAALLATLLYASIPFALSRALVTVPEDLFYVFFLLGLWMVLRLWRKPRPWTFVVLTGAVAGMYGTHLAFYLVAPLLGALFLLFVRIDHKVIRYIIFAVLAAVGVYVALHWQSIRTLIGGETMAGQTLNTHFSTSFLGTLVALFAVLGILTIRTKKHLSEYLIISVGVAYFTIFFLITTAFYRERYYYYIGVFLVLSAALFFRRLTSQPRLTVAVAGLVVISLLPFTTNYSFENYANREDVRGIVWLNEHIPPHSLVVSTYPIFPDLISALTKQAVLNRPDPLSPDFYQAVRVTGHTDFYLFLSKTPYTEAQNLSLPQAAAWEPTQYTQALLHDTRYRVTQIYSIGTRDTIYRVEVVRH